MIDDSLHLRGFPFGFPPQVFHSSGFLSVPLAFKGLRMLASHRIA